MQTLQLHIEREIGSRLRRQNIKLFKIKIIKIIKKLNKITLVASTLLSLKLKSGGAT
jgi:hypothetical protein